MALINYSLEVGSSTVQIGRTTILGSDIASLGWSSISSLKLNSIGASSYVKGINLGGMVCIDGFSGNLPLMYGITQSMSEGNPSPPSIVFNYANMWRFKWSVVSGTRTITIKCKQVSNESPRPTITVEANPLIGVMSDVTGTAPSGTGWVDIGPVTITPTTAGMVWVKIKNNLATNTLTNTPAYFDHIVVT